MKKILISAALSIAMLSSMVQAGTAKFIPENTTVSDIINSKGGNLQKMYKESPEFFTTSERLSDDLELEQILIASFDEKFVQKKETYSTEEYTHLMNSYFIDALKTNNSELADFILYKSGAIIDVNYQGSVNPRISPLQAAATGLGIDGGNIEYFIKLIEMGADPSEVTKNYNIPLMSLAATVDNYKIVLYLALIGQNVMHVDDYEFYALDYATRNDAYKTTIILSNLINEYTKGAAKKNKIVE